jgi:molybdenum cofactor cytidylyltransferase
MTVLSGAPVAIVLAAGESRRLGRDKLFAPLDGQAMVERVVHAMTRAEKVRDVVLVVPPDRTADFSWLASAAVHVVECPDPSKGMIASIRTGLASPWGQGRDFLLCPADVPFVKPAIVDRVIAEFLARPVKVVVPAYKGLGGHPGLFAASLREEFFLRGDAQGAREILLRHRDDTARISVFDPDVCFDVDTEEDLAIAPDPSARWARVERDVEDKKKRR